MLGCETAGIIRGVPILPNETASSGGCRGASKNCVARSGAVGSSEMNRQSEFPIEEHPHRCPLVIVLTSPY